VDDADFIGEKRVQGDPRGPGGPPHNFGRIRSFGKKYAALGNPASGSHDWLPHTLGARLGSDVRHQCSTIGVGHEIAN